MDNKKLVKSHELSIDHEVRLRLVETNYTELKTSIRHLDEKLDTSVKHLDQKLEGYHKQIINLLISLFVMIFIGVTIPIVLKSLNFI